MKNSSSVDFLFLSAVAMSAAILFSACEAEKAPPSEVTPDLPEKVEEASVGEYPAEASASKPVEAAPPEKPKETLGESVSSSVALPEDKPMKEGKAATAGHEVATLGGGCFWCTEAVMVRLEGVNKVVSGYMGGHVENPTYEQIGTKTTGHAEVIEVTYDPTVITYEEILDVFWQAHDPTTLNQQGADIGPQYRSVIFYHSPEQRNIAIQSMKKMNESGMYSDPAVTEITEMSKFWIAEDYHQNYYELNKDTNPYCRIVISPKLKKLGLE